MSTPDVTEFLKDYPLYRKVEITHDNVKRLAQLTSSKLKLDSYCPSCSKVSTFKAAGTSEYGVVSRPKNAPPPSPAEDEIEDKYEDFLRFNKEFKIVWVFIVSWSNLRSI